MVELARLALLPKEVPVCLILLDVDKIFSTKEQYNELQFFIEFLEFIEDFKCSTLSDYSLESRSRFVILRTFSLLWREN